MDVEHFIFFCFANSIPGASVFLSTTILIFKSSTPESDFIKFVPPVPAPTMAILILNAPSTFQIIKICNHYYFTIMDIIS